MAGDGSVQPGPTWPMVKFVFAVDLGDGRPASFAEVSGLASETHEIEYRHGDGAVFAPVKMPGLRTVGNVTLKRGIVARGSAFWDWFDAMTLNTVKRRTVVIALRDEAGAAAMTWTLTNAFPVKAESTSLKSDGDEVAIEAIEIAYESLTASAA